MYTSNRDDRKLENTVKQSWFKHLGELHKEWTEAGVSASRVTTLSNLQEKGYQAFWNRNIVRSILPRLRRKRTALLLSGPKSAFQIKVNFAFHLEIKVPETGEREERHIIHVAWSPVWRFHSQWWFGLPCHLLVLVHCVFWSPQSMQPSTRKCLSTSCFLLLTSFMEMLISFSSRTWHLPTLPKVPKDGSMTMVLLCLIGQQTSLTWAPLRIYGILSRGKWETPDPTMQMTWRPLSKQPGLPLHLSSATRWLPSCHAALMP